MSRFLLIAVLTVSCGSLTGCFDPTPSGGILADNQNGPPFDNALIRVWVLSEEQIQNPPTTKEEAAAVENFVTYPNEDFTFLRDPGTYFVVASNETHFQSLADNDAFEPNVDFSLLQVEVGENVVTVGLVNTDTPTLLPELTEQ